MNKSKSTIHKWKINGLSIDILVSIFGSCENKKTSYTSNYSSKSYSSNDYSGSSSKKTYSGSSSGGYRKKAMTKEEADRLRGTGYHGTRPNSSAENTELAAAQNVCSNCGYHTKYGKNSICQYCRDHGVR